MRSRNPLSKPLPDEHNPATATAAELAQQVVPALNDAQGASWYEQHGNPTDYAVIKLCRLRRAAAGDGGGTVAGDDAVRRALEAADPEAVVWLASRVISYMDEQGYPELYERMFG